MLVNVSDVSIEKQMSDGNKMLTGSKCFSGLLWPLLTDAKSTNNADIGDDCIRVADVRGICTRGVCIEGSYTRGACIRDTCLRGAGVGVVCIGDAYSSNTCVKDTCAENASFAVGTCIDGAGCESICASAHKPSKSFIKGSRLLVELISKMLISSCLCLQVILNSFS